MQDLETLVVHLRSTAAVSSVQMVPVTTRMGLWGMDQTVLIEELIDDVQSQILDLVCI